MTHRELCAAAEAARQTAYAPYSGCLVGAALLTASGKMYTGCNVENASYGATICAERTAFAKAISDGEREFEALAVAGGAAGEIRGGFPPCGICRQVMAEFCSPDFVVMVVTGADSYREYRLDELLPHAFDADSMS